MKFLDFFAGIGGFRLGMERAGHECVGACEIAKAPRKVYASNFGHAPTWSDICGIEASDLPPADLWVGGFPCQDLSTAGKGAGIDGDRSGLVWKLLGLAAAVRPDWLVLENVPGILVAGRGFGRLPRALAELGYVGAWRTLDARVFSVAQRRHRVFLLARRAGARGPCPAELLLQPAGVHRDLEQGEEAGEVVAGALTASAGGRRGAGDSTGVARCLTTREGGRRSPECETYVYGFNGWAGCTGDVPLADAVPTLGASRRPAVLFSNGSTAKHAGKLTDLAGTILASGNRPNCGNGGTVVFHLAQVTSGENRTRADMNGPCPTLAATSRLAVAVGPYVRMLTVTECERVMGFPDGWTKAAGKDKPRRKCLGNAVVPSVIEWIGQRLARAEAA